MPASPGVTITRVGGRNRDRSEWNVGVLQSRRLGPTRADGTARRRRPVSFLQKIHASQTASLKECCSAPRANTTKTGLAHRKPVWLRSRSADTTASFNNNDKNDIRSSPSHLLATF